MDKGEQMWSFETARFRVVARIQDDFGYQYDGDDEDGETQRALDNGEMAAFDTSVVVYLDGMEVGRDDLYGSVYRCKDVAKFFEDHRSADPMNRNCSIYRDAMMVKTGYPSSICHYFPDMVRHAICEARKTLETMQSVKLRTAA